ncbi:prephenate dehydratase [Moorena producens PAL-8-15-08-1]|uniref:Prephenate dehydratase n=1 Tax=Moorena producens PAL-8-15-08-1 TaxID=1458985 RepID=A0A1D8U079_9CYAN|nr:prephenate dehydratase [Moorena producens]AOX03311.1 prephenate dehydratase [Moorena producens PAL-8-15-08-1]
MSLSIAYLGPPGTYTEAAATAYAERLQKQQGQQSLLCPYPSIGQTLQSVANQQVDLAVVPVENSIEGSVAMTLDRLWQLDQLQIQQALVLPIRHCLMSRASTIADIKTVYSHPQALAQCQGWLEQFLPSVQLVPTNSTTEALQFLDKDHNAAAIASERAAKLYTLPVLASNINDYPDNFTRFWVLSLKPSPGGSHTSLAFSPPANIPGSLSKPLQVFARRGINLSRIESRPTKRLLGEYIFFIELESDLYAPLFKAALEEIIPDQEILKIFGSYTLINVDNLTVNS